MTPDPDDQVPQKAPRIERDLDRRERQVFEIRFGTREFSFTSQLTVRRHPGTDEITLALAPRKDKP